MINEVTAQAIRRDATHIEKYRCCALVESLRDEMRIAAKMLNINHDPNAIGWLAAIEKLHELEQKIVSS